jgi:hypothetical protein
VVCATRYLHIRLISSASRQALRCARVLGTVCVQCGQWSMLCTHTLILYCNYCPQSTCSVVFYKCINYYSGISLELPGAIYSTCSAAPMPVYGACLRCPCCSSTESVEHQLQPGHHCRYINRHVSAQTEVAICAICTVDLTVQHGVVHIVHDGDPLVVKPVGY